MLPCISRTAGQERKRWLVAVGQAIREFRTLTGVSQEKLGYRAGFHRTYLSDLECGHRNPTAWTLKRLTDTLGTTPSEVFQLAEKLLEEG